MICSRSILLLSPGKEKPSTSSLNAEGTSLRLTPEEEGQRARGEQD